MSNSIPITNKPYLLVQSNSPGELSHWVCPLVRAFKALVPDSMVHVILTPCQYASGKERDFALEIPGVDRVSEPKETLRFLRTGDLGSSHTPTGLMCLGGDPMYSRLLGARFGIPVMGYSEHQESLGKGFSKTFSLANNGDLMACAISDQQKEGMSSNPPVNCVLFTGSRPAHFKAYFPIVADALGIILKVRPDFPVQVSVSPFISESLLAEMSSKFPVNIPLQQGQSSALLAKAKVLVTLPGTNTAEAMYMGVPVLTVIPLNRPDLLIFDGLLGILGRIPLLGTLIKRLTVAILRRQDRCYSIPNRRLNHRLCPELLGDITPAYLADQILQFYDDEAGLDAIRSGYHALPVNKDLACQMAQAILGAMN